MKIRLILFVAAVSIFAVACDDSEFVNVDRITDEDWDWYSKAHFREDILVEIATDSYIDYNYDYTPRRSTYSNCYVSFTQNHYYVNPVSVKWNGESLGHAGGVYVSMIHGVFEHTEDNYIEGGTIDVTGYLKKDYTIKVENLSDWNMDMQNLDTLDLSDDFTIQYEAGDADYVSVSFYYDYIEDGMLMEGVYESGNLPDTGSITIERSKIENLAGLITGSTSMYFYREKILTDTIDDKSIRYEYTNFYENYVILAK
jgi:hypothetical protein